ncbi:MAG TPA: matrixin family metalloprotease, partial [Polyangium sp.]|nr:matrixin family metalloprotease [Polyangium sp.]
NPCVGFSMQADASSQVSLSVATTIFEEAFKTWANADCGGGKHPRISVENLGTVECNEHEYNKDAGNANIILFQDTMWPHAGANSTLALTTVTYNIDTGEIYDADMEVNSANVMFTTDDKTVKFDLASIATHETGHFLGLSHSPTTSATMFSDYSPGSTELRTLDPDDVAAICDAYPPGSTIPSSCDASPRRGLASQCDPPPTPKDDGSCAVSFGQTSTPSSWTALSIATALAWFAKRRRDRFRT